MAPKLGQKLHKAASVKGVKKDLVKDQETKKKRLARRDTEEQVQPALVRDSAKHIKNWFDVI